MPKFPMTIRGAKALREELDRLKKVERTAVIKAIAEARAHGDLKENAEYHAAKEKQGFIEARIADLEAKLSNAQIIDVADLPRNGKVVFGVTVELINIKDDTSVNYQIVGEDEADVQQRKISVTSPIAKALIGKVEGDTVEVKIPSGSVAYEVAEVKYI